MYKNITAYLQTLLFTLCSAQKPDKNENCEESDAQAQSQTPPVKLRRPSTSDGPRPSSTPPVIAASGMKEDEDEEEKIMAELEVKYGWKKKCCEKKILLS